MKRLALLLGAGLFLTGCTGAQENPVEDLPSGHRMYYEFLQEAYDDSPPSSQENICRNWEDDPALIKLMFLSQTSFEIASEFDIEPSEVTELVERFFNEACA